MQYCHGCKLLLSDDYFDASDKMQADLTQTHTIPCCARITLCNLFCRHVPIVQKHIVKVDFNGDSDNESFDELNR